MIYHQGLLTSKSGIWSFDDLKLEYLIEVYRYKTSRRAESAR